MPESDPLSLSTEESEQPGHHVRKPPHCLDEEYSYAVRAHSQSVISATERLQREPLPQATQKQVKFLTCRLRQTDEEAEAEAEAQSHQVQEEGPQYGCVEEYLQAQLSQW